MVKSQNGDQGWNIPKILIGFMRMRIYRKLNDPSFDRIACRYRIASASQSKG